MKIANLSNDIRTWNSRDFSVYGFVCFFGCKMQCVIGGSGLGLCVSGWSECIIPYVKDLNWECVCLWMSVSPECFSRERRRFYF